MKPYLQDPDFTLWLGDVREVLRDLPADSVDCVVTSPPYFGLRDYGVDGQLGLEATPVEYVAALVGVFGEVRRVLAPHGTVWLNLGDSYSQGGYAGDDAPANAARDEKGSHKDGSFSFTPGVHERQGHERRQRKASDMGLKPKNLIGIPWRTALALQDDDWYLRSEVIWAKEAVMPESADDRPTRAHEHVFMLTKSPHYWFDQEAVREKTVTLDPEHPSWRPSIEKIKDERITFDAKHGDKAFRSFNPEGRNVRTVWTINPEPFHGAHFAVFPTKLVRRCLLASCPIEVCRTCGKPRDRIVETNNPSKHAADDKTLGWANTHSKTSNAQSSKSLHRNPGGVYSSAVTKGWTDCGHDNYRPGVALDPFLGSGTTALVARRLARSSIGIELSPVFAQIAAQRLSQQSLFA